METVATVICEQDTKQRIFVFMFLCTMFHVNSNASMSTWLHSHIPLNEKSWCAHTGYAIYQDNGIGIGTGQEFVSWCVGNPISVVEGVKILVNVPSWIKADCKPTKPGGWRREDEGSQVDAEGWLKQKTKKPSASIFDGGAGIQEAVH